MGRRTGLGKTGRESVGEMRRGERDGRKGEKWCEIGKIYPPAGADPGF